MAASVDEARRGVAAAIGVLPDDIVVEPRTTTAFRWASCRTLATGRLLVVGRRLRVTCDAR